MNISYITTTFGEKMKAALKESGISNHSIRNVGNKMFDYYECTDMKHASRLQRESEVVKKWDEYMADILIMVKAPITVLGRCFGIFEFE